LLAADGVLVIISPFTWLEKFTSEEKWLGGVRRDSEAVWTLHGVVKTCLPELRLLQAPTHMPFVIPDCDGSCQYTFAQCMTFVGSPGDATGYLKATDHMSCLFTQTPEDQTSENSGATPLTTGQQSPNQ
jgi:hypothetical protein